MDYLKDPIKLELKEIIDGGDTIVSISTGSSTTKKGEAYNNEYCHVWKVKNNKIVSLIEYLDTQMLSEMLSEQSGTQNIILEPISILLTTKGHPFDKGSFFQLFDSFENVEYTHVEHPAAQLILNPLNAKDYSVLVFYDMPGIDFHENHPGKEIAPSKEFKKGFLDLSLIHI